MSKQRNQSTKIPTPVKPPVVTEVVKEPVTEETGEVSVTVSVGEDNQVTFTELDKPITETVKEQEPVVEEAVEETPVDEPETVESYITKKHGLKYIPHELQSIIDNLKAYNTFMDPKCPTDAGRLLEHQYTLNRCILGAVTLRDTKNVVDAGIQNNVGYIVALDIVMWFFRHGKNGAFSELALHRRLQDLRIDKQQYNFLQLILTAICLIVNDPSRKRSIKWNAITKELSNATYQHRVLAFFVNGQP